MKKITLEYQEKKVTNEEIETFLSINNFKIPNSYKESLIFNNGGVPLENMFVNNDLESGVSRFYSLKYGKVKCLEFGIDLKQIVLK